MQLFTVFTEVMLPVLLMTTLGAIVGRKAEVPVRALSSLVFLLFTPALVFNIVSRVDIGFGLSLRIAAVVLIGFVVSALAAYAVSRALRAARSIVAGTTLCACVANFGNMGLPISALAFGTAGLEIAVVAFVSMSVLTFSVGVVIASSAGSRSRMALLAPLRVPALWAVGPALLVNATGVALPGWIEVSAETLAGAAIPAMLAVLGLQFATRLPKLSDVRDSVSAVGLRLVVGPLAMAAATVLVGLDGVPQRALIVLGGMPTAVVTTIIAARYDAEPELVARTVLISTLSSIVTLTVLVAILQ